MVGEISVVVVGSRGKMGTVICAAIEKEPGLALSAGVDIGDDLAAALAAGPNVLVDFTAPNVALEHAMQAAEAGVSPIIGTTGLGVDADDLLARSCLQGGVGGAIIPNFAIGAVLLMRLAEVAAPYFDAVEVIEAHHETKLDAPSGTALTTAHRLAAARRQPFMHNKPEKTTLEGTRGGSHDGVAVHSVRLPGVMADQEVIFGTLGQTLSLAHRTTNREAFLPGIFATIRKVEETRHFYRSLDEVLSLSQPRETEPAPVTP
jgi:4-hydroxy-tetrahydrodipicolinate reductase